MKIVTWSFSYILQENVENCIIQESNPQVVDSLSTQTESPTAQP